MRSRLGHTSEGGQRTASPAGPSIPGDDDLTRDDVFHVLRNRRRRYALHYLIDVDEETDIGTLAEQVAAWENRVDVEQVSSTQRKRVYNSLQQTHLPTLAGVDLVEYEADRGTITTTERADEFDVYLDVVANDDISWSRYYLVLGGVSTAVVIAAALDVFPFSALPDLAWTAFVATSLLVSAVVHAYAQRRSRLGSGPEPPDVREDQR